ncbi:unnamed protein product [Caenorhabditis nigoni]
MLSPIGSLVAMWPTWFSDKKDIRVNFTSSFSKAWLAIYKYDNNMKFNGSLNYQQTEDQHEAQWFTDLTTN